MALAPWLNKSPPLYMTMHQVNKKRGKASRSNTTASAVVKECERAPLRGFFFVFGIN